MGLGGILFIGAAVSAIAVASPGGLPQRPKVLSSGGSGVSEQAFRLRSFVRASPGTGLRAAAARFYKKGGITLVHTSSTSAPELAAVLL